MKGTRKIILATILTITAVGQIILSFLLYDENGNTIIRNIGWITLWISAIFGWLPIFTLRKLGGVPQGKGYVYTTVLVDRGIYAIVRHPQYLAGMLLGLALSFIAQHWVVAVLGVVAIIVYYVDTYEEEAASIEKFGEAYRRYMKRVPRVNFILGILRLMQVKQ